MRNQPQADIQFEIRIHKGFLIWKAGAIRTSSVSKEKILLEVLPANYQIDYFAEMCSCPEMTEKSGFKCGRWWAADLLVRNGAYARFTVAEEERPEDGDNMLPGTDSASENTIIAGLLHRKGRPGKSLPLRSSLKSKGRKGVAKEASLSQLKNIASPKSLPDKIESRQSIKPAFSKKRGRGTPKESEKNSTKRRKKSYDYKEAKSEQTGGTRGTKAAPVSPLTGNIISSPTPRKESPYQGSPLKYPSFSNIKRPNVDMKMLEIVQKTKPYHIWKSKHCAPYKQE
eukprot:Nk52_evm82s164 gene=Nk52_evmTU82s164